MKETPKNPRGSTLRYLSFAVLGLALSLWVLVPVVLSLPLPGAPKGWATVALLVAGGVAFWACAVARGKEVVRRYGAYLDPRRRALGGS